MTSSSSPEHLRLIRASIAEMHARKTTRICAAHIGDYPQPPTINGFIPDVTGYHGNALCIVECETTDGLTQAHTREQWAAFFKYAEHAGGYFIAVVAQADKADAETLLRHVCGSSSDAKVWAF